ncbi:MAG TPA: T9SS type A sorting domain-containing protein, partial [Cyclobacteriaceae bacterium]|nr:T9SS type A sorting domain-containing protein [Cyclobacteriaceae bacterium]
KSINLDQFSGEKNVRVAFMGYNGNGNNLYIDNIEFYVTGFSSTLDLPDNSIRIFPNPLTDGKLHITLNSPEKQPVTVTIVDSMGRIIYSNFFEDVLNQTYELSLENLRPGVYVINARGQTFSSSQKAVLPR